jgi:hypothetical protein
MQPDISQANGAHVNGTFLGMTKGDWLKAGLGALAGGMGSQFGVVPSMGQAAQTNPYAVPTINKTFNPATGAVLQHVTGSTPAPGIKTHFATGGAVQMPQGAPQQAQGQDPGQQLLQAAVAALTGQIKDPNAAKQALEMFTQHFGQQALQELVAHVKASTQGGGSAVPAMAPQGPGMGAPGMASGGIVQGSGDGMSDSVPAQHQSGRGIMLSNSEYVVPADAVSQLGNGSSSAGAAKLDAGVAKLRKMKYGRAKQPGKLKPNENPVLG